MKSFRLYSSFLLAAAFAVLLLTAARAEESATTIKFSDPSKPGTIKIVLARGDLRIKGEDTTEVTVKSEAKPVKQTPRKDGLRVLTASSSFSLTEKDNVVTLDAMADAWIAHGSPSDFRVTVPRGTNVTVSSSFGGDVTCAGVTGDLEINSLHGEIRLEDVAGGAIISTMNGEIHANVRELHEGKSLSFASTNGEVVVRVPADAKANIRLRTQNGSVLTDFDDKSLVTKTENAPRTARSRTGKTVTINSGGNSVITPEVQDAIREAARAGAVAVREAAQAVREAAQAARAGAKEVTADSAAPMAPMPPMPPLPPMTGGKLVTGTLNGGGPEISVATMNGDVTLRQLEKK